MPVELYATVAAEQEILRVGDSAWVELIAKNQTFSPVSVINPDVGIPPDRVNWPFSKETYQISILLSFHLITILMVDASGQQLPMVSLNPWVTPIFLPRLSLDPGNSFTLRINLSDHFQLQKAGKYHLFIHYGDEQASAHAETDLLIE